MKGKETNQQRQNGDVWEERNKEGSQFRFTCQILAEVTNGPKLSEINTVLWLRFLLLSYENRLEHVIITMHLHMSGLMCHHKGRGETILMVQSAAPHGMAHACHWGVTLATREEENIFKSYTQLTRTQ